MENQHNKNSSTTLQDLRSEIDKIETLKEVKDYYLYERGWIDSDSMVESLIDFIIYLVKE